MKLVIVESPAKAKTINKYLGNQYKVVASFGHVRDLPSKNGSVLPDENFKMQYEIPTKSKKYVTEIVKLAKNAEAIYLATDPDREGESISWHVVEILKEKKALKKNCALYRIAFNEITKKTVNAAINNPRQIDSHLVDAQQARRALDYLVGFTLSPVLWRKLPGCKSAGRVQSVALRIICEREREIEKFESDEFWDINLELLTEKKELINASLSHINGEKLEKLSIQNEKQAKELTDKISKEQFGVLSVQKKNQNRVPAAPFITSSLQQEAARKLGFTAKKTMQIAQKLYEGIELEGEVTGLITYMRTDGVALSAEAVSDIRNLISQQYGPKYLPSAAKIYKSKAKNAQEAHEAIRPTHISFKPEDLAKFLDKDQLRLYDLIWKRTVACQMENAVLDLVGIDFVSANKEFQARATGSTIKFDGFYKVYKEDKDDTPEEEHKILPALSEQELLTTKKVTPAQHFTQAPPRFTEASLVKRLEELGIGRPSTYSSIISVLQERNYVTVEKKRFFPNDLGRLLTSFLVGFFAKYVEYNFTASLEDDLDKIAEGELPWKNLLSNFWQDFTKNINVAAEKDIKEIIAYIEHEMDFYLFGKQGTDEYESNKKCKSCSNGRLELRLGKYGAFLSCSNYPDCSFSKPIHAEEVQDSSKEATTQIVAEDTKLGTDPASGEEVLLKKGPYGWYIQLGANKGGKAKPKRSSVPQNVDPANINLDLALKLLSLPMLIGKHSESAQEIHMGIGKYGPYLKYQNKFTSIPKEYDAFNLNLELAEKILAQAPVKKKSKD